MTTEADNQANEQAHDESVQAKTLTERFRIQADAANDLAETVEKLAEKLLALTKEVRALKGGAA